MNFDLHKKNHQKMLHSHKRPSHLLREQHLVHKKIKSQMKDYIELWLFPLGLLRQGHNSVVVVLHNTFHCLEKRCCNWCGLLPLGLLRQGHIADTAADPHSIVGAAAGHIAAVVGAKTAPDNATLSSHFVERKRGEEEEEHHNNYFHSQTPPQTELEIQTKKKPI
jgi:hypothetical protein